MLTNFIVYMLNKNNKNNKNNKTTQKEIAEYFGLTEATISRMKNSKDEKVRCRYKALKAYIIDKKTRKEIDNMIKEEEEKERKRLAQIDKGE